MNERIQEPDGRFHALSRRLSPPSVGVVQNDSVPTDGKLCLGVPAFHDDRLFRFLDAWLGFRGDRAMPRRRDIDPAAFPDLLAKSYLYERYDRDATGYRYRCVLAGEDIHQAWNGTIMGRDVAEMFDAKDLPKVDARWSFILDRPAALHGYQHEPEVTTSAERLLLPVTDDDDNPCFVFGATIYQREQGDLVSNVSPPPQVLFYDLSGLSDGR